MTEPCFQPGRRRWLQAACGTALLLPSAGVFAKPPRRRPARVYVQDFEALWQFIDDNYAYFHRKVTNWVRVHELFGPLVTQVNDDRAFIGLLEAVLKELYDPHATLGVNTATSPRLIPSDTDVWGEWKDGRARLADVRAGSAGERAGARPGMEVLRIGGVEVAAAIRAHRPIALDTLDPAAEQWALNAALAGNRNEPVRLDVRTAKGVERIEFRPGLVRADKPLFSRRLAEGPGYLLINNSLGDAQLPLAFDIALAELRDAPSLILDLRDTPSGGNTTVARALMGRLLTEERPYQRHELVVEARRTGVRRIWVEYVAPRGPFAYAGRMVVLAGRWTGSMGEGLTIGLQAMERAVVIGTPMAQLMGAIEDFVLPVTRFTVKVPTERLFNLRGVPREDCVPDQLVSSVGPERDAVLEAALAYLRSI